MTLRRRRSGRSWDRDASQLLDYFRTAGYPASNGYARIVNKTFRRRKLCGEQGRDYVFYHFSAPDEQQALINWANPGAFTLTKAGTVTHAANRGFTPAGGVNDALTSTFNLSTAGVGTNDVSVELYSRTNAVASTRLDWGGAAASTLFGRIRFTSDVTQVRLTNTAAVSSPNGSVTDTTGLFSWLRNSTGVLQACRNGVQVGSDITVTDQALTNQSFNWGNAVVGANSSSTKEMAFARIAQGMTAARCLEHYQQAVLPLLQWNGANV